MGGLFGVLDIASSALFASQAAINTTSNNIANVNTPGYDTETTLLEPVDYINLAGTNPAMSNPGGVTVAGVQRQYDSFLRNQIYQQQQSLSGSESSGTILTQLEQAFNETGSTGLAGYYNSFVDAWQQVAGNPTDTASRTLLLSNAQALAGAAQEKQGAVQSAINQANDTIAQTVQTVNSLASKIAGLNQQIAQMAGSTPGSDNQLRDERDNLMNQLAQNIDFTYYEDSTGQVTIIAGMRNLVSGNQTNALSVQPDANGDNQIYLDGINITSNIQKGSLGGLIAARSDAENQGLTPLRRFIAAITQQVNQIQEQGYGLDGSTGNPFFSPLTLTASGGNSQASISASVTSESQLTLDEYNISVNGSNQYTVTDKTTGQAVQTGTYSSGNPIDFSGMQVVISGSPAPSQIFTVSPLTNAVNDFQVAITDGNKIAAATQTNAVGDNSNALDMVSMLQGGKIPGLGNGTMMDYYQNIVSATGTLSQAASDSQTFNQNLLDQLKQQSDSVSGVSLDEESVNLIKYQQAYQAAAKVVETTNQLLQSLMSI